MVSLELNGVPHRVRVDTLAQWWRGDFATLWRSHMSIEMMRTRIQTDPHAPARLRVVGPLSNSTAFAEAFALPDDAPVMRDADERIEIW